MASVCFRPGQKNIAATRRSADSIGRCANRHLSGVNPILYHCSRKLGISPYGQELHQLVYWLPQMTTGKCGCHVHGRIDRCRKHYPTNANRIDFLDRAGVVHLVPEPIHENCFPRIGANISSADIGTSKSLEKWKAFTSLSFFIYCSLIKTIFFLGGPTQNYKHWSGLFEADQAKWICLRAFPTLLGHHLLDI